MATPLGKHSCVTCAQRKVKCNKLRPCSNCHKANIECMYRAPAPSQRHRKRPPEGELLAKLSEYEDLLRKHNIKFTPQDASWISSPLEEKLISQPSTAQSPLTNLASQVQLPTEAWGQQSKSETVSDHQPRLPDGQGEAAHLWSRLPRELRDPAIDYLTQQRNAKDRAPEDRLSLGLILLPLQFSTAPSLLELHPQPKHVFKLWQVFAENVNPLSKVIHAPSLQQRISEVSWDLEAVPKPLEAVMFSIYALAITSMKASDCVESFNETRPVLLNRYRSGAMQALVSAGLHTTRDLEVLQALILFLLLEPRSESSLTALAVAIRIGHKMGLHQACADPHIPFFEQEMRVRVWWQARCLEGCARRAVPGPLTPRGEFGNIRLPLNVNDAELHPQMAGPPAVEHSGATEMLYCLMKYRIAYWVRTSTNFANGLPSNPRDIMALTTPEGMAYKRKVQTEVESIYEDNFLRYCDPQIPLHHISATVARLMIHHSRFLCYQPRHQPDNGRHMSRADQDAVFESSVRLLELNYEARTTNFSAQLLEHLLRRLRWVDALVYMLSELRRYVSGDLVCTAWTYVGRVYEDYRELVQDDGKFYTALADLTLEAWEARSRELQAHGEEAVPGFIAALRTAREKPGVDPVADTPVMALEGMGPEEGLQFGFIHDDFVDWGSWNDDFHF